MTIAVIVLSLLGLTLGTGLVLVGKWWRDERKRADNAMDLYHAQLEVKHDLETTIADLTGKLASTDKQLQEASAKIVRLEISLAKAQKALVERTKERIANAENPLSELSDVLQERAEVPGVSKAADSARGGGQGADSLLITDLK